MSAEKYRICASWEMRNGAETLVLINSVISTYTPWVVQKHIRNLKDYHNYFDPKVILSFRALRAFSSWRP